MNSYFSSLKTKGYLYHDKSLIKQENLYFQKVIKKYFSKNINYYNSLSKNKFRQIALEARDEIQYSNEIVRAKKKVIKLFQKIFNTKSEFLASSYFAFFPTRNLVTKKDEQLDFHRETTYGGEKKPYHAFQYNIWIPVFDVEKNQNLNFVEKSHLIKDEDIKLKNYGKKKKKKTASHTLGYAYWPKKIVGGVPLHKAKRFKVPKNNFLIFDGNLIHGSGTNEGKNIRFAIVFGIIAKEKFKDPFGKSYTFRSGQPTFAKPILQSKLNLRN